MKRFLSPLLVVACSAVIAQGAPPPPDQTNEDVTAEAPVWLTYVPTNEIPPDLSAPDLPVSLSSDSSGATPPLADALAALPPVTSPDDPAPEPDPEAPPPDSQPTSIQPDCDPDSYPTNQVGEVQTLGVQAPPPPLALTFDPASSDRIAETARALDYNWAQCYLFVRNQIRFTPCKGIQRGPLRTLLDREGSDGDQAFLLLALLQSSGYTNSTVFYVSATNGGFRIKLGGTASGYDACSWLGIAQDNVPHAYTTAYRALQAAMLGNEGQSNSTFDTSIISVEHFWVGLTLNGQTYNLDPSFKPRRITASRDVLSDIGYSRTNLLAQAGGTTNGCSVQGINTTTVNAELCRLSSNLSAKWRAANTNSATSLFVGGDEVVPQDLVNDTNTFHGTVAGLVTNFIAQPDAYKNGFRYKVSVSHLWNGSTSVPVDSIHQGINRSAKTTFWLDEIADRALWFQYNSFDWALLMLESTKISSEYVYLGSFPEAAQFPPAHDSIQIVVAHPFGDAITNKYPVTRAPGYINSVAIGFGGDHASGMRELTQEKLESLPQTSGTALQRARLQQVVGQQWLAQTTLVRNFLNHRDGRDRHVFYNIGITAQTVSPYVDLRNCYAYQLPGPDTFDSYMLFASALEHGVLDQVNGTNRPAVSTVRIVDLANASNQPIYFATSANWGTVTNGLTNYDADVLSTLSGNVRSGHKALLPKDGRTTLNKWKGYGYIDYGNSGKYFTTMMAIGGPGLGGGYNSCYWDTQPADVWQQYDTSYTVAWIKSILAHDPVDTLSGAYVADKTDLSIATPMPLALTRHYDSRLRYSELPMGRGWSHNYDANVSVRADPDALLGHTTPDASVASAVATAVAADLISAEESAKNFATACLVVKWWTDQLVEGAATVQAEGKSLAFTRRPDGSYSPAPGVTATLVGTNHAEFTLTQRLGNSWHFDGKNNLDTITDPSGNFTKLYYDTRTNLVAVSNSFGAKLTFVWSSDHQRIAEVDDSAGRSVSYTYDTSHRMSQVTDPANFNWKLSYNSDYALASQTDPENVITVQNTYNPLGQVTNQLAANAQRYIYAFAGGVSSWERDPFGRRIFYTYTDEGRLARRVDHDGTTNAFFYDAQGQMITNIDALGRATVRVYDASNNLMRVVEAANTTNARTTVFVYDSQSHLMAVTNALGRPSRMTYDDCHRVLSQIAPDGTLVTNVYDGRGLLTSTRTLDANGQLLTETTRGYGSLGLATNVSSTDAGSTIYRYDQAGNVTNVVDALGRVSRFSYDDRGLLTSAVDPASHTVSRVYTKAGRLQTSTDPLDRDTTFRWTRSGKQAAMVRANGALNTNYYDMADNLMASKDPRGNRVDLALDCMGRTTNRYTAVWSQRTWYDPSGSPTTSVDAVGGRTDIGYDGLNRPVAMVDAMNRLWQTGQDPLNGTTNAVDARGRITNYGLDLMGRRVRTVYPSGRTEGFGFDALGRQTSFTNSEGHVYRMAYDGQGRLIAATNGANEQVFRDFYDVCGNLTNHVDGVGRPTVRQYDVLNHCTNTVYADGTSEAFTYDAAGNLLTARNAGTTNTFGYDLLDHLTTSVSRVWGVAFTNCYRVDLGGLVTNIVYPGGKTVRCFYDLDGRVTNVVDWSNRAFRIFRDAAGRMTSLTYPNGVVGAWGYDASHAVTNWLYSGSDPNLPGRAITRDEMGLKAREDVLSGPMPQPSATRRAVNAFDAADRLVSAQVTIGTNSTAEAYNYDGCGALTNVVRSTGTNDFYLYDPAGRLIAATASNLALVAGYDAIGNRVRTTVSGATHFWAVDHADPLKRPLMETDTNGVPIRYYIWGAGMLLAVIDADGTTRYAHCDDHGNVLALTGSSGSVLFTASYGPYGENWGMTGTNAVPFDWLGGHGVFHADGSSLYLTRHRAFDTNVKRFLSQDPMGLGGGANLYGYANGNPLLYIDPLGLCAENSDPYAVFGKATSIEAYHTPQEKLDIQTGKFTQDMSWANAFGVVRAFIGVMETLPVGQCGMASIANEVNIIPKILAAEMAPRVGPLPAGEAPYQLKLFPDEPYDRVAQYGRTPTAAQRASVPQGMEFDHNPTLVQHYYEGADGGLPGFNLTQTERLQYSQSLSSGSAATPAAQRAQGAAAAAYSKAMKKPWGLE